MFSKTVKASGPWVNVWLRSLARHGKDPEENNQGGTVARVGAPIPTSTTVLLAGLIMTTGECSSDLLES